MRRFKIIKYVVLLTLSLMGVDAHAAEELERAGFWGGMDVGAGYLQQSSDGFEANETTFFLGFQGGYTLNEHFLLGLELSGWLLQASDLEDPSVGEGISQVFLVSRYYPSRDSGFFVKGGGGYVSYWNNRPGEPGRLNGWGVTVGGGYDFSIDKRWALTPFVTYSRGSAGNEEYDVFTVGLGITLQ
jgi:hypothetical protein